MVDVYRPENLGEILSIRRRLHATPFAGGTDLMVRFRKSAGVLPAIDGPVLFVDRCPEMQDIHLDSDVLRIGAAATMSEILEHDGVNPELKEVLETIAAPALRNVATVGGNICNASPAADTLPLLYAFDAQLVLASEKGERTMPVREFVTGPGTTKLAEDQILKAIVVPNWRPDAARFRKVGTRKANALTKTSVAGYADVKSGKVEKLRIAAGAVGPTVLRFKAIEDLCTGEGPDGLQQLLERVHAMCLESISPIDDQRSTAVYRRQVTANLVVRFLEKDVIGAFE